MKVKSDFEVGVEFCIIGIDKEINGKFSRIYTYKKCQKIKEIDPSKLNFNLGDVIKIHINRDGKNDLKYFIKYESDKKMQQSSKYPKVASGCVKPFERNEFRERSKIRDDACLSKLIDFYIIKNPSIDSNKNPTTVKYFDIKEKWGNDCWRKNDGSLKNMLIETVDNYKHRVYYKKSANDMKEIIELQQLNNLDKLPSHDVFCFVDSCKNVFNSIFRHIRNSFAHGRFFVYRKDNNDYIFMEDTYKNKVTSRIVVKVETLIKWIDLITCKVNINNMTEKRP